ncbi:hypothetical protein DFH09DRAFT_1073391 [Mycena vulgaris]|nr:hypothetical protein DFH09DRAFT_1073391 [Mycena vulgaris]
MEWNPEADVTPAEVEIMREFRKRRALNPRDSAPKAKLSDKEKRQSHAEAQRRYRESHFEETRAKARERMKKLRARGTTEEALTALEQHRDTDAKYREHQFRVKYGFDAFTEFYFPKYRELGKRFLPRLEFDEGPAVKKKKTPRGKRRTGKLGGDAVDPK